VLIASEPLSPRAAGTNRQVRSSGPSTRRSCRVPPAGRPSGSDRRGSPANPATASRLARASGCIREGGAARACGQRLPRGGWVGGGRPGGLPPAGLGGRPGWSSPSGCRHRTRAVSVRCAAGCSAREVVGDRGAPRRAPRPGAAARKPGGGETTGSLRADEAPWPMTIPAATWSRGARCSLRPEDGAVRRLGGRPVALRAHGTGCTSTDVAAATPTVAGSPVGPGAATCGDHPANRQPAGERPCASMERYIDKARNRHVGARGVVGV
jgi:hypothetical protein